MVIAENVKGLLLGEAKSYVREIYREFDLAGYYVQHWLLDASKMGVPQRRERVFFICLRKDLAEPFLYQQDLFTVNPKLELNFNEPEIPIKQFAKGIAKKESQTIKDMAENEAKSIKNSASAEIAKEKETMLNDVKSKSVDLILKFNAKLFSSEKVNKDFVETELASIK